MRLSLTAVVAALVVSGCGLSKPEEKTPEGTGESVEVTGSITESLTWSAANTYTLKTHVFVENNAVLTIEPGTRILGESGSSLVITRGAKLNAVGTREKPIVFTSAQPEGSRKPADWGGVVLLGRAPINVQGGEAYIEGFAATTDERTKYGGGAAPDAADSCGALQFARIEFAGFKLVNNNELNGLTLGGCGSGTKVDFVQVHRGADDGVEMFGGTADLKHILITLPDDDGLDWDHGYTGRVQFLIVQQGSEVGNNAFEGDNNPNNKTALPMSAPRIWNATLIGREAGGSAKSYGMHLKNGTAGQMSNLIVAYFADHGIDFDKGEVVSNFDSGALSIRSSIFYANKGVMNGLPEDGTDNDDGFSEATRLMDPALANRALNPVLEAAQDVAAPSFKPRGDSPALTGGATPPNDGFFDVTATFVGAVGTEDWTSGWTAFPLN